MLHCSSCGRTYEDRWRCECGHPLDFAERPLPDAPDPSESDIASEGLWAFDAFIPVAQSVSLGEGFTPLVDAPEWECQFKLEYVFPTGSFKDRGATTVLSRAVEVDAEHVVEDSSGNAGSAIATYAARAGLDCTIYVPSSVKPAKVQAIERAGAEIIPVEGSRERVTEACIDAVESGAGWYASHAWNPAFFEGTATMAYELAYQRGWDVPDAVVMPLGHGTLFLGAYRGFQALFDAGWVDEIPRLLGVQSAGYDPIASELHGDSIGENEIADGIQIREPVRRNQLLDAIDETDGDCIALGREAVETERDALHSHGFYVEPTSAIAPAALRAYRDRGVLSVDDDVVVPLTGSGLKT
jgi:threonine synthase